MRRHEIDRIRIGEFRRNDEVAFVLTVLVIDKDIHAPVPRIFDDLLNRTDRIAQRCFHGAGCLECHGLSLDVV